MAADLEEAEQTQQDSPLMLRSSGASGVRDRGKRLTLPGAEGGSVFVGPTSGPSAAATLVPLRPKHRGAGTAQTAASQSLCGGNSFREAWQHGRATTSRSFPIMPTEERSSRAVGDRSGTLQSCSGGSRGGVCIRSSSRSAVPAPRPSSPSACRKDTCTASWAAVAAAGIGGGRRPAAATGQHSRSSADASAHPGSLTTVYKRRLQSSQQDRSGAAVQQTLPASREAASVTRSCTSTSWPHTALVTSGGQEKAGERSAVTTSAASSTPTQPEPHGHSRRSEKGEEEGHDGGVAEPRDIATCVSGADTHRSQQEFPSGSSADAGGGAPSAATARPCAGADSSSRGRSGSGTSGGMHVCTDEGDGLQSNNSRGSGGAWSAGLRYAPSVEGGGGQRGEDDFALSKLLHLLPRRGGNQTVAGAETCGPLREPRKQADCKAEQYGYNHTRRKSYIGTGQQPSASEGTARDGGGKTSRTTAGKTTNDHMLSDAEAPSMTDEATGAAPAQNAFYGSGAEGALSSVNFSPKQEEKNSATAAASREIAYLPKQWPQGHQQRKSSQAGAQQQGSTQGENSCLAEAVCHDGNIPRGKVQMGFFTETSPLDENVLAAWLPSVVGPPGPGTEQAARCGEQQRCTNVLEGSSVLSGSKGAREGASLSLAECLSLEAGAAFAQGGFTAAGTTSTAQVQERQMGHQRLPQHPHSSRTVGVDCGGNRVSDTSLQAEAPSLEEKTEEAECRNRSVAVDWRTNRVGATLSRENPSQSRQLAADQRQQQPLWQQALPREKDKVVNGIESLEQEVLQRFVLTVEEQRNHRSDASSRAVASISGPVCNAVAAKSSSNYAAPPFSLPQPARRPPLPPFGVADACPSEWLRQGGEQTGEREPSAQQQNNVRNSLPEVSRIGIPPFFAATFQNEGGSFRGGIPPPPGLAARVQQQQLCMTETERKIKNGSHCFSSPPREQQNVILPEESASGAQRQVNVMEQGKTGLLQDGSHVLGIHDHLEGVDSQHKQQHAEQQSRQVIGGEIVGGGRNPYASEQGQQLWQQQQQQHQPRRPGVLAFPVASRGTGEASTVENIARGVDGGSLGIWQLKKVLSVFHQQLRASADRQCVKPNSSDVSAASAVLRVAQRVAEAAMLRQEQRPQTGNRSEPPSEVGSALLGESHENGSSGSNNSNSLPRSPFNIFGRLSGEEQAFTIDSKLGLTSAFPGVRKAAGNHGRDGGAEIMLSAPARATSSAYSSDGMHRLQDEQKGPADEVDQVHAVDGSRHRSCPVLAVRSSAEGLGGHSAAAEGVGGGGFSYRPQQQQRARSPPVRSPTLPYRQRQRVGRQLVSRGGYVEPTDSHVKHARETTLRQVMRGLRGNFTMPAEARSSSCVPLPSSVSEPEQEDASLGVAVWEKVHFVSQQQRPQQGAATAHAAEIDAVGAEGSRFVSHEQAGIFCFGGRRGEAGELCNEIRVLQRSGHDTFCWATLPVSGTPPPPCSGMAIMLAWRPESVVTAASPCPAAPCSPEDRTGQSGEQEAAKHHFTSVPQVKTGAGSTSEGGQQEAAREVAGRRNSRSDTNEKETLPSSGSSQEKLQEPFRTPDGEKLPAVSPSTEEGWPVLTADTASPRPATQQREGGGTEKNGTPPADVGESGGNGPRMPRTTPVADKESFVKEMTAEQLRSRNDRRATLLVYGGRYVDGFADWNHLYECDLTTGKWRRLQVDASRLPSTWSWPFSAAACGRTNSPVSGDTTGGSTTALSCASCVSIPIPTTKSLPRSDMIPPTPPLPGALQESSWCYSELDDSVYVFGGVWRESHLHEHSMAMAQAHPLSQQKQQPQHPHEQQEGEAEKDAEHSSDELEPSGSESRGEGITSVRVKQVPPAWQCQNMLWRLDLGRLQWTLVEVETGEESTGNMTADGASRRSPQQHDLRCHSSQDSLTGNSSTTDMRSSMEKRGGFDAAGRSGEGCVTDSCLHGSKSPVDWKREEGKLQGTKEDKHPLTYGSPQAGCQGDLEAGKWELLRLADREDQNAGESVGRMRSVRKVGDDKDKEDAAYDEEAHLSRCTYTTLPKGRAGHTCVYKDGALWIFGGSNTQEELADFFRFDVKRQNWQEIKGGPGGDAGRRPCARYGHAATVLADFMILFGGYGGKQAFLADLYTFHFSTYSWVKVLAQGAIPAPRFRCGAGTYDGHFFVFAGRGGMQYPGQQQGVQQQQQQLQRHWSDSLPHQSGDGGGGGTGCKRSVVFVDAVRIRLPIREMLLSHQHIVFGRDEQPGDGQQADLQHEQSHFKALSRSVSSTVETGKMTAKQELRMNSSDCTAARDLERLCDDAAQQRTQLAGGANPRGVTGGRLNPPFSGVGNRNRSREGDTSTKMRLQTQRSSGSPTGVTTSHDLERNATADRVSAVAAAVLELLQQQAIQKAAGRANSFSSVSRGGDAERASAATSTRVDDERSNGPTTTAALSRLRMQLCQQLLPCGGDAAVEEAAGQPQHWQTERGLVSQYQDLVRTLQARLQDAEHKARTTESEQRQETSALQEQIRRVSVTLTTLYTKLWNAANEVSRTQKENERLKSELAARDAVITRQQAEFEALTAKYRRSQLEVALLLKSHEQQGGKGEELF